MPYPELGESHQILGTEYCSGFTDTRGNWNNGFYCPEIKGRETFCCGTPSYKYCCKSSSTSNSTANFPEAYTIGWPVVVDGLILCVVVFLVALICVYGWSSGWCERWRKWSLSVVTGRESTLFNHHNNNVPSSSTTSSDLFHIYAIPTYHPSPLGTTTISPPHEPDYSYPQYCPPSYYNLDEQRSLYHSGSISFSNRSQIELPISSLLCSAGTDSGRGSSRNSDTSCSSSSGSSGSGPSATIVLSNPTKPLTLINVRNNMAYITSAVPLSELHDNHSSSRRTRNQSLVDLPHLHPGK